MECNKDEAIRAKSIAECKFEQKDFFGARKFALKAQSLYPGLDGISQMLTTVDVYVAAENKISGEIDWYGVLSVSPSADDEMIKKQYRKLALMLHPDKNNSIGADGAFKLIAEAWKLLSDKTKRLAYNQRRGYKVQQRGGPSTPSRPGQQKVPTHTGGQPAPPRPSQQKVPTQTGNTSAPSRPSQQKVPTHTAWQSAPSMPSQQKGPAHACGPSAPSMPSQFSFCASRETSAPKSLNRSAKVRNKPNTAPPHQRTDTFWTTCRLCNTQYEHLKIYLNSTLLCHNCQRPFMASETAPPVKFLKSAKLRRKNTINNSAGRNAYDPRRNAAAAQRSGVGQAHTTSFVFGNYQQGPPRGTANPGSTEPSTAAKVADVFQEMEDKLKRPHIGSCASSGFEECFKKKKIRDDSSIAQGLSGLETSRPNSSTIELTPLETQKLMVKAQKETLKDLSESNRVDKEKYGCNSNILGHGGNEKNELSEAIAGQSDKHRTFSHSANSASKECREAVTIDVPGSDFHDFDEDRSEHSFAENEVWAAYDDDGMPRSYALIRKVVSRDPFELMISWLHSETNCKFSNMDLVGSGFYRTCGEFKASGSETCKSIKAFSQKVNWSKGPDGSIIVLPQKGDCWALFRNWSSKWSEDTPKEVVHKYDMVMALNDYNNEHGISIAPLVKVPGFRMVFLPNMEAAAIQRIQKEDMFRFSHRVPNHNISREAAPNAPEGSVELDPAAIPLELLRMITETGAVKGWLSWGLG